MRDLSLAEYEWMWDHVRVELSRVRVEAGSCEICVEMSTSGCGIIWDASGTMRLGT